MKAVYEAAGVDTREMSERDRLPALAVRRCFLAFLYRPSATNKGPFSGSTSTRFASPVSKSYTSKLVSPSL